MALISVSNNALSDITALPAGLPTGALTLLSTQTASASASISFTSGIDSTYDSYVFKLINIHAGTDNVNFTFQGSTNGGSSYGVTITSTYFNAYHNESDSQTSLNYDGTNDLAQSTSFQMFTNSFGADNDQQGSGTLQIFNPSSTTFVKHFIARLNNYHASDYSVDAYVAGYFNTTSAIDAVQFKMSSGNFDGIIKMYGVS